MKATASALILAAALSAACGEGRAIFNVDVHSFIQGTGEDTIPYAVPPNTSVSASNFQQIDLPPGFGSSIVESATLAGAADLRNTSGAGMIGFQLYVAADSAGTLLPAALAVNVDTQDRVAFFVFDGAGRPQPWGLPVTVGKDPAVLDVLTASQVWIRIVAKGYNADLVTPVIGDMVLTALQLRVVFQDKLF